MNYKWILWGFLAAGIGSSGVASAGGLDAFMNKANNALNNAARGDSGSCNAGTFTMAGMQYTCANIYALDNALTNQETAIFSSWGAADFDNARAMAKACPMPQMKNSGAYLTGKLNEMQAFTEGNAAHSRQMAAMEAQEEKERKENEAKRAEEQRALEQAHAEAEAKRAKCINTHEYRYFAAARAVEEENSSLHLYLEQQKEQKEIARTSGVRDLVEERRIGEHLYHTQAALKDAFQEYKHQGGKAKSPDGVEAPKVDPCKGVGEVVQK